MTNPFYGGGEDWSQFVEHPRFGRGPRYTSGELPLGSEQSPRLRGAFIPGTAVEADPAKQVPSPFPALYYFDLKRVCRDCRRCFLFFADEQKHWYEVLGFTLNSNCVRCTDCRRKEHEIARWRLRYEELCHTPSATHVENLELAETCLKLIEAAVFPVGKTTLVRRCLNLVRKSEEPKLIAECEALRVRVVAVEGGEKL